MLDLTQLSLFESSLLELRASDQEALASLRLVRARVHRILQFNEDDGTCLLDVRDESNQKPFLISTRLAQVWPGQSLLAEFKAGDFESQAPLKPLKIVLGEPSSARSLKKFLKAGAFGRLGKKTIELLSNSLSGRFFSVLQSSPSDLLQISGIGQKRLDDLVSRFDDFVSRKQLSDFLFQEDLPLSWGKSLWALQGRDAVRTLLESPYETVSLHGFHFDTVDAFALKRGFEKTSPIRLRAGLNEILHAQALQGHCACPDDQLIAEATLRLGVETDAIEEALEIALVQDHFVSEVIHGVSCIYTKEIWTLERDVAERLLEFSEIAPTHHFLDPIKSVAWAQRFLDIQLSIKQREAVESTLESKLSVITGGPGTGKTTLVRCLVTILNAQYSRFALCAPTGRASQRLRETTGASATTIHRLLRFDGVTNKFIHNRQNPLKLDIVLVDEASMLDLWLMSHLLEALPEECALVLIGDAHQLPSVGAGAVLQSLISSKRFPVIELTDMFRQSADSGIRLNAERIHQGLMPINGAAKKNDFRYIPVTDRDDIERRLREIIETTLPRHCGIHDLNQVQILTPTNRGAFGTRELNERLRDLFAHGVASGDDVRNGFRIGDKVIVNRNDYAKSVFNGDIGKVLRIAGDLEFLEVDFGERVVVFNFDELDALTLAYAISIHKSQGSEYRAVVILLTEEHLNLAQRHLVYTAVTRGKDMVFLLAQPKALKLAISRADRRWQKLTELLAFG